MRKVGFTERGGVRWRSKSVEEEGYEGVRRRRRRKKEGKDGREGGKGGVR